MARLGPSTVSTALRAAINANQPWEMRCCVSVTPIIYRDSLPGTLSMLLCVRFCSHLTGAQPTGPC